MRVLRAAVVGLGAAVVPLDFSVNVAFPAIVAGLGLEVAQIQWVVIAYVMTYGGLMLACGRLGDMVGHALVFRAGLMCSIVGLGLCSLAPSFGWLLLARGLQGVGAALAGSCAPALITALYREEERPRALALYGMFIAIASAAGPLLGGPLVAWYGWTSVFWFRIPIVLLALALFRAPEGGSARKSGETFDLAGAILFAGMLLGFLSLLDGIKRGSGWQALAFACLAAALLAAFIRRETVAPAPMIDLRAFRGLDFSLINLGCALINFGGFFLVLLGPFFFSRLAAFSDAGIGILLAVGPLAGIVFAALAGRLIGRWPAYRVAWAGAVLSLCGVAPMTAWDGGTGSPVLFLCIALQGAGMAMFQVAYLEVVSAALGRAARGVAGSLSMVTRMLGVVAAAGILTLVFQVGESRLLGAGAAAPDAFLGAYRAAATVAAASILALVVVGAFRWLRLNSR